MKLNKTVGYVTVTTFAAALFLSNVCLAGENKESASVSTQASQQAVQKAPRAYGLINFGYAHSSAKIHRGKTWEGIIGLRTSNGSEAYTANVELMISELYPDGDDLGRAAIGFGTRSIWTWNSVSVHLPMHLIYTEKTTSPSGRSYSGFAVDFGVACYYQLFSIGESKVAIGLQGKGVLTSTASASNDVSTALRSETGLGLYIF